MFITHGGVVGACPTFLEGVAARNRVDYAPERWTFKRFRRLPVEKLKGARKSDGPER